MADFPSLPWFCSDYLGDTRHLSLEEHGAYCLLLMTIWLNRGSIPDDDKDNARMLGITVAKWLKIKARLAPMLTFYGPENEQKITQKRLQKEWNYVATFREKQREKGKRSGESRRHNKQGLSTNRGSIPVDGNDPEIRAKQRTGTRTKETQPEANTSPNKSNITTSSIAEPRENSEKKKERGSAPSSPGAALPDGAHPSPSTSEAKGDRRNVHSLLDTPAMRRADAKLGRVT